MNASEPRRGTGRGRGGLRETYVTSKNSSTRNNVSDPRVPNKITYTSLWPCKPRKGVLSMQRGKGGDTVPSSAQHFRPVAVEDMMSATMSPVDVRMSHTLPPRKRK